MPLVDLVDETFVAAAPAAVSAAVHDPARWAEWWPDLRLTVFMDRGAAGLRWSVTGELTGSCELWLEPALDGVVVHHYLRVDPVGGPLEGARGRARLADRLRDRHARRWKRAVNALKDELEAGRAPGMPVKARAAPAEDG